MLETNHKVLAVVVGDLHLTHVAPVARKEKDWYAVQKAYLTQIEAVVANHPSCVVIYVGDIFDKGWDPKKCPPELINFALENLPQGYAIPGQHDLPYHRYGDLKKSAYYTLVHSGLIENLPPEFPITVDYRLILHGFPWGFPIEPAAGRMLKEAPEQCLQVAVCHKYIWSGATTSYVGAPQDAKVSRIGDDLAGYHVAVFGDNHVPFSTFTRSGEKPRGVTKVVNCGTFMRRKADEIRLRPRLTLIHSDGRLSFQELDVSRDEFADKMDGSEASLVGNMMAEATRELLAELSALGGKVLDFGEAVVRYMEKAKTRDEVRAILLDALKE